MKKPPTVNEGAAFAALERIEILRCTVEQALVSLSSVAASITKNLHKEFRRTKKDVTFSPDPDRTPSKDPNDPDDE